MRQDSIRGHHTLKMEATSSSETTVTIYQQTVRNATEILDFNHESHEILRSRSFSDIKAMFRRTYSRINNPLEIRSCSRLTR